WWGGAPAGPRWRAGLSVGAGGGTASVPLGYDNGRVAVLAVYHVRGRAEVLVAAGAKELAVNLDGARDPGFHLRPLLGELDLQGREGAGGAGGGPLVPPTSAPDHGLGLVVDLPPDRDLHVLGPPRGPELDL